MNKTAFPEAALWGVLRDLAGVEIQIRSHRVGIKHAAIEEEKKVGFVVFFSPNQKEFCPSA